VSQLSEDDAEESPAVDTREEQKRKSRSKTRRQNKNAASGRPAAAAMDATMSMQVRGGERILKFY
jgi:hypothetical protein